MKLKITILDGDGIGPEVTREAVRVLQTTAGIHGHEFTFTAKLIGGAAIQQAGMKKVGLLGTRYTMEEDFLNARLRDKFGIEAIVPEKDDRDTIHAVIYNELVKGVIRDESRTEYLKIIDKLTADGAEGIILGCTEIPLLVSLADTGAVLFDTTRLHAEQAVDLALDRVNAASL